MMVTKPCAKRTKKELIDTACKERGLFTGLSKLKKYELVDLCCNPDGSERYLRQEWDHVYTATENSLVADILLEMDKETVKELLQEKPDTPSRSLWNKLSRKFKITRGNILGNPVKCDIPVPDDVKDATLLATRGDDVYDYKDVIKHELNGVYVPQMQSAWTWHLDKCNDLANMFEKHEILMGDVTIEPCTATIWYPVNMDRNATRFLDPRPIQGMFAIKRERTEEEGIERATRYKQEIASNFDLDIPSITEEKVRQLISDPATSKYFHEKFGGYPAWQCIEPVKGKELLNDGNAKIIDRDAVAFDDEDISPSYLNRQREILPRIVARM